MSKFLFTILIYFKKVFYYEAERTNSISREIFCNDAYILLRVNLQLKVNKVIKLLYLSFAVLFLRINS